MLSKHFASSADFVSWVNAMRNAQDFAREYQAIEFHYRDGSTAEKARKVATVSRTVASALHSAAFGGRANLFRRERIDTAGGATIRVHYLT